MQVETDVLADPPASAKTAKAFKISLPAQLVTIDSESTRDLDDGLFVERVGDGYRVVVCIADPTGLVAMGSTEDENAKLLGATVYVRDQAVRKMLPARISEGGGSLIAGKARKCFVFEAVLDGDLELTSFTVERQAVTVSHRLSYDDVPLILQAQSHELYDLISNAASLAHKLMAKRRKRGALAIYDLARLLYMDEEGRLMQLARKDQVVGNVIVQEMMVMTNTLAAAYMVEHDIPGLFRNHEAKAAAPDSEQLARTIETWLASGAMDADQMQTTFSMVMGRAQYGASVTGHYALAQPIYGHFTSPLRRYADLVNLRQLRCHLTKGELEVARSLGKGELQVLAEHLNEKAVDRKEERSDGFKEAVKRHATRAMDRGDLSRLADHEIVQAIKIGVGEAGLSPVLVDELVGRFNRSVMTDKITDCLLTVVPASLWTVDLKVAFRSWLILAPARSVHLLVHAQQTGFVKAADISATGAGTAFVGRVKVISTAGEAWDYEGTGSRKRDAEQNASVRAVLDLVGCEPLAPATSEAEAASAPKVESLVMPSGNPKGALLELCTKRGWPMPDFVSAGQGPSHAMVFSATVTVQTPGRKIVCQISGATTKKDAEARASEAALKELRTLLPAPVAVVHVPPVLPSGAEAIAGNPVGTLQEAAQRNKWQLPDYAVETLSEVPPKFRVTVTVYGPKDGRSGDRFTGEATTKQEAKKRAAQAALSGR